MSRKFFKTSLSLDPKIRDAGRKEADAKRRSFSSYVSTLIEADILAGKKSKEKAAK